MRTNTLEVNYKVIILVLLFSLSAKSQESLLSKEIKFVKSEVYSRGFEVVNEDTILSNFTTHLIISSDNLQKGYIYYWVVFTDSYIDRKVQMNYWNSNSLKYHPLEAILSRSDANQRLEYTFAKNDDLEIKLETFIESSESTFLYSILFKKEHY